MIVPTIIQQYFNQNTHNQYLLRIILIVLTFSNVYKVIKLHFTSLYILFTLLLQECYDSQINKRIYVYFNIQTVTKIRILFRLQSLQTAVFQYII